MRRPRSDAEIIDASISDPQAIRELFARHFGPLFTYFARRLGRDAADDLTADVFLIAFDRRERYDLGHPDARPWLYGIAANLLRRHRRTEARRLRAQAREAAQPREAGDEADERLDGLAAGPRLAWALARLSADQREALLLFAWADLGYEEIARALDVPVGTVRSRLSRARERVRRELGGADRAGEPTPDEEDRRSAARDRARPPPRPPAPPPGGSLGRRRGRRHRRGGRRAGRHLAQRRPRGGERLRGGQPGRRGHRRLGALLGHGGRAPHPRRRAVGRRHDPLERRRPGRRPGQPRAAAAAAGRGRDDVRHRPGGGGWVELGPPESVDPGSGTTPAEYLAATRDDVFGETLRRITGGMEDLATRPGAGGATIYSGSVAAGLVARESGLKEGRRIRVFPFGYVAHGQAADPAAPLDVELTVGGEGLVRRIAVAWGGAASPWTYVVEYDDLGATAPIVAPPDAEPLIRDPRAG